MITWRHDGNNQLMTDTHDDLEKIMKKGGRPRRKFHTGGGNVGIGLNTHIAADHGLWGTENPPPSVSDVTHMVNHYLNPNQMRKGGRFQSGGRVIQSTSGQYQCPGGGVGLTSNCLEVSRNSMRRN